MITLPPDPSRRLLRSFWIVVSLAAGGLVAVLLPAGAGTSLAAGAASALAAAVPGLLRPRRAEGVYRWWNHGASWVGRACSRWISGVSFFVLVTLVGRAGSRMPWAPRESGASGWFPRHGVEDRHDAQHRGALRDTSESGWVGSFGAWARDSANLWAWGLVPVLGLLRVFRPKVERSLGENIYTLY